MDRAVTQLQQALSARRAPAFVIGTLKDLITTFVELGEHEVAHVNEHPLFVHHRTLFILYGVEMWGHPAEFNPLCFQYWTEVATLAKELQVFSYSPPKFKHIGIGRQQIHTIDINIFPKSFAYVGATLRPDLADVHARVDAGIRAHLAAESTLTESAVLGVMSIGFGDIQADVIGLSGVSKEMLGFQEMHRLVNRACTVKHLGPGRNQDATREWEPDPGDSTLLARAKAIAYQQVTDHNTYNDRLAGLTALPDANSELLPKKVFSGRSISQMNMGTKGTFGLYVRPIPKCIEEVEETSTYGITASHVVNEQPTTDKAPPIVPLVVPGGWDMMRRLSHLLPIHQYDTDDTDRELKKILRRWDESCGEQINFVGPGTDSNGWRTDLSLLRINSDWIQMQWESKDRVYQMMNVLGFSEQTTVVKSWHPPKTGDRVFKIGSASGIMAGTVNGYKELLYSRGTGHPDVKGAARVNAVKMLAIYPDWEINAALFAQSGDSGSAVFAENMRGAGVDFVGLLVSALDFKGVLDTQNDPSRYAGLMIPAHSIFDHLKEATGREWTVVGMESDSE